LNYALGLGIEPLVEVNNEDEIQLALKAGATLVTVDTETTTRLAAIFPEEKDVVLCALRGISTRVDAERYLRDKWMPFWLGKR
jgi:indole-3-glycerol phosphate synthase